MRLISHTFREWHIVLLVALFCFAGCAKQSAEQETVPSGNSYASGFQITPTDTGVVVEVFQPYQRVCIKEPMRRLGTMSTVQVGFLYATRWMRWIVWRRCATPNSSIRPLKATRLTWAIV